MNVVSIELSPMNWPQWSWNRKFDA